MSSATVNAWPEADGEPTGLWARFRAWRRSRPFWGGLLAMIAGLPILYFPYAHLSFNGMTVAMSTTAGAGSMVIGLLLIALGLTAWFQPLVRVFCGVATTILALISIPVSNLGGFGLGLITGLIAGGLLCAWAPLKPEAVPVEAQTAQTAHTAEISEAAAQMAVIQAAAAPAEPVAPVAPAAQEVEQTAEQTAEAPAADPGEQK